MKNLKITRLAFLSILQLIGCISSVFSSNLSEKTINLTAEVQRIDASSCYLIEDRVGTMSLQYLLSEAGQEAFIQSDKRLSYNEHVHSAYWQKIILTNRSSFKTWLLEYPDPHIGTLQVYVVSEGRVQEYQTVGFEMPFARALEHKNFVYEIPISQNAQVAVYARIKSSGYCGISPNVRSVANFSSYFFSEYHLLGMYYGIIFIMIAYNLFLGIYTKDSLYFFYCLYTVCCAFYTFAEDGLGFQWLWRELPLFNNILEIVAPVFLLASFLLYSNRFLEWKTTYPKIVPVIIGVAFFYGIMQFFFFDNYKFNNFLLTIPFLLTCFSAMKIYQEGFRPARFFVLGNSIILVSLFVFFFRMNGWVASNTFTVYLFNVGFIFEAVVLSISLADKFRITKVQKDLAQREIIHQLQINDSLQQKVNKELEGKVKERTKELQKKTDELQTANANLEELKKELYAMNSKMDVNIWELKKEVKKEVEARVLNDTISLQEFSSVYTDVYCYQYLKDLKWKNGFECPKCGNKKFGRGNNNFTYKCTQCQHQESVTSNTLFHAIKFPVSKAFYLAYYLHKNGNDVSYEELATKLGLSKNTVWKFGKKVLLILDAMGKKAKSSDAWDKLILTSEGK